MESLKKSVEFTVEDSAIVTAINGVMAVLRDMDDKEKVAVIKAVECIIGAKR